MKSLPAFFLAIVFVGCLGSTGEGPCLHSYYEPILTVQSATDCNSGEKISYVNVHSVSHNGKSIPASSLVVTSRNVEVQGDTLYCLVPFGFGHNAGTYRFTVEAVGYLPQVVEYQADYQTFKGGCPSYSDDGLDVDIKLSR